MAFGLRRPFQPKGRDRFIINLGERERAVIKAVCEDLLGVLDDPAAEPLLRRVYPIAHVSDATIDEAYQEMVHSDLVSSRRKALVQIVATAEVKELDPEHLESWMIGLNTVRLVLGSRLDVTEGISPELESDDPDLPAWAVYEFLGGVIESIVRSSFETL